MIKVASVAALKNVNGSECLVVFSSSILSFLSALLGILTFVSVSVLNSDWSEGVDSKHQIVNNH